MKNNIDLSVAIEIIEKKIADLNIKITKDYSSELEKELNVLLNVKKEIYKGNTQAIKKVLNS